LRREAPQLIFWVWVRNVRNINKHVMFAPLKRSLSYKIQTSHI
jgi:hypothetical protein